MNAKVAVTITVIGDTRKQLSSSDGGFVFDLLLPGPYTVTVEEPSVSRMLSNVTVVAGDRARVDAHCFIAGGTVIAYLLGEGIAASDARVVESNIRRRRDWAMGHLLSGKLIPRRGKGCFISTNRTCWKKA
jgi:hypothetical protein